MKLSLILLFAFIISIYTTSPRQRYMEITKDFQEKNLANLNNLKMRRRSKRYLGISIASPRHYWFDMTQQSGYVVPFFFGRKANETANTNIYQNYVSSYFDSLNG